MKNIHIVLFSVLLFVGMIYFALRGLMGHIYERKDCDRFVIDHVELRTNINIPAVKEGECECSNESRTVRYTLDLTDDELRRYLSKNKYDERDGLYINEGEREDTRWFAQLNPQDKELYIQLEYLIN